MGLLRAIATVGSLTMVSRIAGFARDILTAAVLGAGPIADAFFVALKLPNFFRRITAEGAFSIAFVPMFSGIEEKHGRADALRFASHVQGVMLALMIPFTIAVVLAMPWVIKVITPGFIGDPVRYDAAVDMARITFPYILLISVASLYGGVLNSFGRYAAFAIAPLFFNLTIIAALLGFAGYTETPAHAMAYAVTVSGIIQLIWMIMNSYRFKVNFPVRKPVFDEKTRKMFRLMGPACIGAGVVQINLFVDMILASFLEKGAISYLYYADRLYQLPLAVIGIAIGTALLPMLARKIKANDTEGSTSLTRLAVKYSLILSIPAAVALVSLSAFIMVTLFERGAFDRTASLASAAALKAYAIGLPAFVLVKIFSTVFYASEDTKTPVKYAIMATLCNIVLGIILIFPFGHVGIAASTAIAAWVNVCLLIRAVQYRRFDVWSGLRPVLLKVLLASILMGAALIVFNNMITTTQLWAQILALAALTGGGMVLYFSLLHATGVFRFREFKQILGKNRI